MASFAGSRASAFLAASQWPSAVIPIGTTSYFERSMDLRIDSADRNETSCSPDLPPKITPTRVFFIAGALPSPSSPPSRCRCDRHRGGPPCELFHCRQEQPERFASQGLEGSPLKTIHTSSNQR